MDNENARKVLSLKEKTFTPDVKFIKGIAYIKMIILGRQNVTR